MNRTFAAVLILTLSLLPAAALGKDKAKAQPNEIEKLEQQWLDAYVRGDTAAIANIEADDFVLNDPAGATKGKSDDIQEIKSGAMKWAAANFDEMKVRFYGKTAIATGIATIKGSYHNQDISGKYRFTDVFVRKGQSWRAVSTQVTPIAAQK